MVAAILIAVVLVLLLALGLYERTTAMYKAAAQLNGPGFLLPLIGNSYGVLSYSAVSGFKEFRKNSSHFKTGYKFYYFGRLFLQTHTAEAAEFLLTSRNTKKGLFYKFIEPYVGTGVLTSYGAKWSERRKLISPSFHFRILNRFFHTFKDHTDTMIERLKSTLNEPIDVTKLFNQYSLGLICETSMGVPVKHSVSASYEKHLKDFGHFCQARLFSPHLHEDGLYRWLGYARKCICLIKPMHEFTRDLIAKRRVILENRQEMELVCEDYDEEFSNVYFNKNQPSLLDALILSHIKDGTINDAGIEEEVNTFVFTGHDTVTAAMTYTMLCIGAHPDVQQKLFEEIQTIVNSEELTPKHLAACSYMDMVIKESLRLFPPVPMIARTIEENMNFSGITLPPGANYQVVIFDLHRDPKWFPKPDTFDPDRFLPENTVNRHHFAYLPFSAGLRNCIGQKYAIMQLKTMIVKMIQQYRLESVTKLDELEFVVDMILHTTHPIEIKFHRR